MTFSDDDLKRLKERETEDGRYVHIRWNDWRALLARLEAAEHCILPLGPHEEIGQYADFYRAWRKAAGK